MKKVRFVDSVDFGKVRPDGKYAGLSGGYGAWSNYGDDYIFSTMQASHTSSLAAASKSLGSVAHLQQNEVFESSEHKPPKFNNCHHTVFKTVCYPFTTGYWTTGLGRLTGFRGWRFVSPAMTAITCENPDWGVVSSNMQAEAYHTMLPRFEGDISMINFIFEMKDFRELSLAAFKRIPRINEKYGIFGSVSAATKRLAEAHLIKSFVVDPTVNDVKGIIHQAQDLVMDAQRKFADSGLNDESRHFSKMLSQSQSLISSGVLGSTQFFDVLKGTKSSMKWTSTMEGNYGYKARSDLEAFTKYWGLGLTAEAVWNALPFSFLIDYLFSIGHSLNVMRHDPNVKYNVTQYSESILSLAQTGYFIDLGATDCHLSWIVDSKLYKYNDYPKPRTTHIAGTHSSNYERVVKQPYWGPFLPRFVVPREKQALNAAALLRCLL